MPKVTFLEMDGDKREIDVAAGTTVLEAARAHDLPITGTWRRLDGPARPAMS